MRMASNQENVEAKEDAKEDNEKNSIHETTISELNARNEELENENVLLRRDLKRKDKLIRVLINKLRANLDSTRITIDQYEKQLLSTNDYDEDEVIFPQDFLDFEMDQDFDEDDNDDDMLDDEDDDDWNPKRKKSKEGKHKCKWSGCGKVFSRNANLTRHYNTHLRNRTYPCNWPGCGKPFTDVSSLKRHRRLHTGEKPYKCSWEGCDAQFGQASILAYHIKSHTGERKIMVKQRASIRPRPDDSTGSFVCSSSGCGKSFENITNLRRHQAIHNGTRLYYCDWQGCDKNFLELSGLKRHRRIHTGERPYKCDWPGCGARYSQSSHLSTHIKSHKNERDYKCSLPDCTFAGVRMSDLRKHLRRKHKWQQSDFDEFEETHDSELPPIDT